MVLEEVDIFLNSVNTRSSGHLTGAGTLIGPCHDHARTLHAVGATAASSELQRQPTETRGWQSHLCSHEFMINTHADMEVCALRIAQCGMLHRMAYST